MDIEKINLRIDRVEIGGNPEVNAGCLRIVWVSDIGFGIYDIIVMKDGTLEADSECMDSNTDKKFVNKLMELLIEKIKIK